MIRSDASVGRYGLAERLPAKLRCISDFDVLQSSMEDSRVLRTHVMETATLLCKFPVPPCCTALYITLPVQMDRASKALAQGLPSSVPRSYRALADHSNVPRSTLHDRARGQRSIEAKAQSQQYLTPYEERAMIDFILQMSALGTPVRIKYISSIAFTVARGRPEHDRPQKPPGKNWAKALEKRHPELKAKRVKALDWDRHEKNIYPKIEDWFELIGKVLEGPDILSENVYNMDETGVMLSKLGSVKVLVATNDVRDYRGARVKRKMVTAVECISADGRYLKPMIIWPASTHRANWTTFPTPGWHYAFSDSGYTDSILSLEWLTRVFDPQTSERANGKPRVTSVPGSRDCPRPETLALLGFSHLRPRSYKHINHLLLFSSSLTTIMSMRDNFMCSVDRTVVQFVATVHLCLDFAPRAEATKSAAEVKTRCARLAAASRSS
ncbi:hypothetical protein Q7P35_008876 [Cladosporium inversicolor]